MGYTAMEKMGVHIPKSSDARGLHYAKDAIAFIRDDCKKLKFKTDNKYIKLEDTEGKSFKNNVIPYNMERDLDRLCLENAIARFVKSGAKEDAFDIYFCYCEIFKPFGEDTKTARLLLNLLSEHESNASSLLSKHRDHYSHSVYVFLTGLAIYKKHKRFRAAYQGKYDLNDEAAAHHFLEYWGFTSLFHDVGYPFEIAFNQVKSYIKRLELEDNNLPVGTSGTSSALENLDLFFKMDLKKQDSSISKLLLPKLTAYEHHVYSSKKLADTTKTKTIGDLQVTNRSEYLDHAYFGTLVLISTYLKYNPGISDIENADPVIQDCLCSIMLHNSLFKHTLRNEENLNTQENLRLDDGMPLTYLLMLCDELQSWDRKAYGQESRAYQYPNDFDLIVTSDSLRWCYYFDYAFKEKAKDGKIWNQMTYRTYEKKINKVPLQFTGCEYLDDINRIICLKDMIPDYEQGMSREEYKKVMSVRFRRRQLRTGVHFSAGSYLNLYDLAVALNGRYGNIGDKVLREEKFEEELSLEYKLSNIAQAKGFAAQLHSIGCFYTDRPMDADPVLEFKQVELDRISESEHNRWCKEKLEMGWVYGEAYNEDKRKRDRYRQHPDLVFYDELPAKEKKKNTQAMNEILKWILDTEGLVVYHF